MTANARPKSDARNGERSPPKRTPAQTTAEIAARLFVLCETIDRHLNKGRPLSIEQTRTITKRIRSYAVRLRDAPTRFNLY